MILQVQDVLKDAMGLVGAIEVDEAPAATEMALALRTANIMIDRWSSQRLLLRSTAPISFVATPAKPVYTIGLVGCDITANKPLNIFSAYYRDSGNIDYPIEVVDITTYNNLADKDVSNGPILYLAYDAGSSQQAAQKGAISIYLTPDQPYTVFMECDAYLTEFVNLTDAVTFEPAYYEALIYNLAVRLFRHYNDSKAVVPADVALIASNSLNNLRTLNKVNYTAGLDLPGKVGIYDIYVDGPS